MSALSQILQSPGRILGIVLGVVFAVEVAVMLVLPHITPRIIGETGKAILDAVLLTLVCSPMLWWIIIGPLRRIAVQEHARSETIVANAGEGILTFDRSGDIVSCNRAGYALFGGEAAALVGKPLGSIIDGLPSAFDSLPHACKLDGIKLNGTKFPIFVSVSEFPSEDGGLLIAVVRDLTESQAAEQERLFAARQADALRAQQMATLAQLATGVAHEIRNPLTSIKLLIQVNRAHFAEFGLPVQDMELVEQEIRRMERSVNGLLEYARPETAEFCLFSLHDVIDKTCRLIEGRRVAAQVALRCEIPDPSPVVYGDAAQIQQLLLNLSLNALDAMRSGGELSFRVVQERESVIITVSDTGTGIRTEILEKLFSPFVTTKPDGVGLGLGICRRIAEAHHGSLAGANLPKGGAQFELTLPSASHSAPTQFASEYI